MAQTFFGGFLSCLEHGMWAAPLHALAYGQMSLTRYQYYFICQFAYGSSLFVGLKPKVLRAYKYINEKKKKRKTSIKISI